MEKFPSNYIEIESNRIRKEEKHYNIALGCIVMFFILAIPTVATLEYILANVTK